MAFIHRIIISNTHITINEYKTLPDAESAIRLAIILFCPAELVEFYTYKALLLSGSVDVEV